MTTSSESNFLPKYATEIMTSITYDRSCYLIKELQSKNSLYLKETNNILNKNIPNFEKISVPISDTNAKDYDFKKAVNKASQDDNTKTLDKANEDTYDLIIQQNTMYILGSLACTSLLIASIFIGRRT